MTDERIQHERLLARIARGERIESPDEMSPSYRESLVHLMTMQADSELAGGYGYVPWITKAPERRGEARGRPDREGRAAPRRRDVRPARPTSAWTSTRTCGRHDESFTMRIDGRRRHRHRRASPPTSG